MVNIERKNAIADSAARPPGISVTTGTVMPGNDDIDSRQGFAIAQALWAVSNSFRVHIS